MVFYPMLDVGELSCVAPCSGPEREQETVDSILQGKVGINLNLVVVVTVQLVGKVSHDGLEERVDGADIECAIVI